MCEQNVKSIVLHKITASYTQELSMHNIFIELLFGGNFADSSVTNLKLKLAPI